jgi:hypothetical protein
VQVCSEVGCPSIVGGSATPASHPVSDGDADALGAYSLGCRFRHDLYMRIQGPCLAIAALLALAGCGAPVAGVGAFAGGDAEMIDFMLTVAEADGWAVTPDEGPVEGNTPDCTGAAYDWPDISMLGYASQFLDREDETVSLVLKRLDGEAALRVDAVRGALEPCAPSGGVEFNGAMIDVSGDDAFAYQTRGSDDLGDFMFSNMVIACGDLILEVSSYSYSLRIDQARLEALAAPVVDRMIEDEGCTT